MKALQKLSKWLSDYTSIVVIAIAVVTFIVPGMMGWVNHQLFTDPVSNKFTRPLPKLSRCCAHMTS